MYEFLELGAVSQSELTFLLFQPFCRLGLSHSHRQSLDGIPSHCSRCPDRRTVPMLRLLLLSLELCYTMLG
jgi:hypothetical protein